MPAPAFPVSSVLAAVIVIAPRSICAPVVFTVPATFTVPGLDPLPVVAKPPANVSTSVFVLPRVTVPVFRKFVSPAASNVADWMLTLYA